MKDLITLEKYPDGLNSMDEAQEIMDKCRQFMRVGPMFMGWTLNHILQKQLYKQKNYNSFDDFVNSDDFGYGRSQAYNWIKAYTEFKDIGNVQRLDKVGIRRLLAISAVKDTQERDNLLKQAPKMTLKEVEAKVNEQKRFSQNINETVSEGDSQELKSERIGNTLLQQYESLLNNFNQNIDYVKIGFNKWKEFALNYPNNENIQDLLNKLKSISKFEKLTYP